MLKHCLLTKEPARKLLLLTKTSSTYAFIDRVDTSTVVVIKHQMLSCITECVPEKIYWLTDGLLI